MKNSLKNKFRNEYENISEQPSKNLWERIEKEIPQQPETQIIPGKKTFNYWKAAAVVLFFVSIGFALNYFMDTKYKTPVNPIVNSETNKDSKFEMHPTESAKENKSSVQNADEIQFVTSDEKNDEESKLHQTSPVQNREITDKMITYIPDVNEEYSDSSQSAKPLVAQQKNNVPKEKTKYVTAEDLLFEREAGKSLREQENDSKKLGNIGLKIDKPKGVKIFGITVYSDESE